MACSDTELHTVLFLIRGYCVASGASLWFCWGSFLCPLKLCSYTTLLGWITDQGETQTLICSLVYTTEMSGTDTCHMIHPALYISCIAVVSVFVRRINGMIWKILKLYIWDCFNKCKIWKGTDRSMCLCCEDVDYNFSEVLPPLVLRTTSFENWNTPRSWLKILTMRRSETVPFFCLLFFYGFQH